MNLASLVEETSRCVACGLCLPVCPTYRKTGSEADSPRGRIQMISAVAQGKLPPNARFQHHIELCLSCRACESVCPNTVRYGALADAARAMASPRPNPLHRILAWGLEHRASVAFSAWLCYLAQYSGLWRLLTQLPGLRQTAALLPTMPRPTRWKTCYPAKNSRGDVALFLGCVSSMADSDTLHAAIFTLNRFGLTVHVPPSQSCCGGIPRQWGDPVTAQRMLERNTQAFAPLRDMPILSVASGCGAGLRDHFGKRVSDISSFLARLDWQDIRPAALKAVIHVHDPCSLSNVMREQHAVREIMQRIPGAEVRMLPGNNQCCGGAGTYMLSQPDMAAMLLDDKIRACVESGAMLVASSNIGCVLHMTRGIRENGLKTEIIHPVALLAKQLGWKPCWTN